MGKRQEACPTCGKVQLASNRFCVTCGEQIYDDSEPEFDADDVAWVRQKRADEAAAAAASKDAPPPAAKADDFP